MTQVRSPLERVATQDEVQPDWYLLREGTQTREGPFTWDARRDRRGKGQISPSDWVWSPALPNWAPAGEIFPGRPANPARGYQSA
jgi:hypothetical protein